MKLRRGWVVIQRLSERPISLTDVPGQLYNFVYKFTPLNATSIPVHSPQFLQYLREGELAVYGTLDTLPEGDIKVCLQSNATVLKDVNAVIDTPSIPRKIRQPRVRTVIEVLGASYRLKGKAILQEEQEALIIDNDEMVSEGIANFLLNKS